MKDHFSKTMIMRSRGYAARANLQKHICKHHDTTMKVFNKCSFCYIINVNLPNKLSNEMFEFYTKQKGILTKRYRIT